MSGAITAATVAVAAMTTSEIFAAVAITGTVIGAIGTVTGIKPLQYAGMALGAVGGIGALAVSAGVFGAEALDVVAGAESASGISDVEGATAQAAAAMGGESLNPAAAISSAATPGTTDFVNAISGQVDNSVLTGQQAVDPLTTGGSAVPDVTPAAATNTGVPGDTLNINDPTVMSGQAAPPVMNPTDPSTVPAGLNADGIPQAPQTPVTGAPGVTPPGTVTGGVVNAGGGTAGPVVGTAGGPQSIFDKILDFAGTGGGGRLLGGALQAGASFISGATSTLTPAQVSALNAQAEANLAAANLSRLQQGNLASGIPTATRVAPSAPVTGVAALMQGASGAPAGLVNTPLRPVTGATI